MPLLWQVGKSPTLWSSPTTDPAWPSHPISKMSCRRARRFSSPNNINATQGLCFPSTFGALCQFGNLSADEAVTVTLVADVDPSVADGERITNTAQVFSNSPELTPGDNSAEAGTDISTSADLSIFKEANRPTAVPGEPLSYLLTVRNDGPSDAQNVIVTDTLPAGFNVDSVSSSQGGCTGFDCNLGVLPAGGEATITIIGVVHSAATTDLTNRAGVSSDTSDPDTANNSTTINTALSPFTDLALGVTSTPTAIAGETAVVTYTVSNLGSSDAQNTEVTAVLPPGATLDSDNLPTGWTAVDNGDGTVTLSTTDPLAPGQSVELPLVVDIDPAIEPGTSLEFSGVVTSDTPDSDLSNNTDNADTSVIGIADLLLQKTSQPDPVTAGEIVTYTITVENTGPSVSQEVQLVDALPNQVLLIDASTTQGVCFGTICFLGDMAQDDIVTITIRAQVKPDVPTGTVIVNGAVVSSPTHDPGVYQNFDVASNVVQAQASLKIEKRDLNDPVAPEETLLYYIVVTNEGPADAVDVVINDVLPAQVTYESDTDNCTESPAGVLTCEIGVVDAGDSVNFLVSTRVDSDVVTGTVLTNNVEVTSTTPLTNSTLTDTEETDVIQRFGAPADLEISKTADHDPVTAGELLTYTLVITNNGPGSAVDVEVVDALPNGLSLISATPSQGMCDDGTCLLGTLFFNGTPSTATIEIVARVDADVPDGTVLLNTAFVQSAQPDPDPGNNTAQTPTDVIALADLEIEKSAADTVIAGTTMTYTVVVTNHGPSDALGVVFTDTLPAGTSYVSWVGCTPGAGNTIVCSVGEIAAGASTDVLLAVAVPADATGSLFNQVVVGSDTTDPNPDNNSANETTLLRQLADISIDKNAESTGVVAGERITYTLVVKNDGPSVAANVSVSDMLSADVDFISATPNQSTGPNPLTWNLGELAVGGSEEIEILVEVGENVTTSALIHNVAGVTSTTPDPDTSNNIDEAIVQSFSRADVGSDQIHGH